MAVLRVPNEKLAVKLVAARNKEAVIVGEVDVRYFVVVLGEAEDGLLLVKIPDHNVGVVATLA